MNTSADSSVVYFIFSPDGIKTTTGVLRKCQEICHRKNMAYRVIELPAYDPNIFKRNSSAKEISSLSSASPSDNASLHTRNRSYSRIWRQNVLETVSSLLDIDFSATNKKVIRKGSNNKNQVSTIYFVIPRSDTPFPYPFYRNYLLSAMRDLQIPLLLALNKDEHTIENFNLLKSLWLQELQDKNIPIAAIASYISASSLDNKEDPHEKNTRTHTDIISIEPVRSFYSTNLEDIPSSTHSLIENFFKEEDTSPPKIDQKNSFIQSNDSTSERDITNGVIFNAPSVNSPSMTHSSGPFSIGKRPAYFTTLRFQHYLFETARSYQQTIVLPESNDERTLRAADRILRHNIARILFIGDADTITSTGKKLGLSSFHAANYFQQTPSSIEPLIPLLTQLRSHKGLSEEEARNLLLTDVNYLGVMLIYCGQADGMVSGACHSTADTVRPALQLIPLKPSDKRVSGAMLMCVDGRIEVHADIALEITPSNERLVEIARQTAATARAFGIDPVIGLLSYSTLNSGKGIDVDKTWEVVRHLHSEYPDLKVVGPIQFDAAWSPEVAAQKIPNNPYAGHVNVYIYPNLTASNIAIKSIEHIGEGIAVGPILQGLEKPITDLSRGADVDDIADTIAATSILAFQSHNKQSK